MNPEGSSPLHGIICLWFGVIADIPDGWVLCDGSNGTPDLAGRFIRGAGIGATPHYRGGTPLHNHTIDVDQDTHNHTASSSLERTDIDSGNNIADSSPDGQYLDETDDHQHIITVDNDAHNHQAGSNNADHRPPYHTLCYIMKL